MKLTLSLLMFFMKYQGNNGKYYLIQKVSLFISFWVSRFITGCLQTYGGTKNQLIASLLIAWGASFIAHYWWFLNTSKPHLQLHYKDYKRYLIFFLTIILSTFIGVNGLNWRNGTDMTTGIASFAVPGIGWAIGAVYFIADPLVKDLKGKGIGEHIGDPVKQTTQVSNSLWNTLKAGLSNLESRLMNMIPAPSR